MKRQSVLVQVEAWQPRRQIRWTSRLTKKLFRVWFNVGRWPVLYADREVVIVKQFGSVSVYSRQSGDYSSAGFMAEHPAANRIPERHGRWRLEESSLKKVKST